MTKTHHQFNRRKMGFVLGGSIIASTLFSSLAFAQSTNQLPDGYPKNYADTITAAEKEGKVVIYSNTELTAVAPIIADFKKLYPKIDLEYLEVKAAQLYSRVTS